MLSSQEKIRKSERVRQYPREGKVDQRQRKDIRFVCSVPCKTEEKGLIIATRGDVSPV